MTRRPGTVPLTWLRAFEGAATGRQVGRQAAQIDVGRIDHSVV